MPLIPNEVVEIISEAQLDSRVIGIRWKIEE